MRLGRSAHLDALCGEYLLGTLRGAARRRFERALRQEPFVASRLASWQNLMIPNPAETQRMQPDRKVWQRISQDLSLHKYKTPWYARIGLWRGWALVTTAALAVWVGSSLMVVQPQLVEVSTLSSGEGASGVKVSMSPDHQWMEMTPSRPVQASPGQSYEVWLVRKDGSAPLSMAVLAALDGRVEVPEPLRALITRGDTLAVSVEPAGGSPTGAPTGPVILSGRIDPQV